MFSMTEKNKLTSKPYQLEEPLVSPTDLADLVGPVSITHRYEANTATRTDLLNKDLYAQSNWLEILMEVLFHLKRRNVTISSELYAGAIQFVSCLYVLAVIPQQLEKAGYDSHECICVVGFVCGLGCIICGFLANLPFIIVPPTAVSIFFSIYLRQNTVSVQRANVAVFFTGVLTILLGIRPIGRFFIFFIPRSIQIGCAIGIGLFTALAGATEIDLVVTGNYTIVAMGTITNEIIIGMSGIVIIAVCLHYHFKAGFCISIIFTTIVWWWSDNSWPSKIAEDAKFKYSNFNNFTSDDIVLVFNLFLLIILFINGLINTLSDLAQLTRPSDGSIPRSRWLYVICGILTMVSGLLSGPPVLISPESAAGIKAGARTGLSTVFCGLLFLACIPFSPIFSAVPSAGTAAILIMIGAILFQNVSKLDWYCIKDCIPSYITLFFIVTTYNILQGAAIGYIMYICINILTGDLEISARKQIHNFFHPESSDTKRAVDRRENRLSAAEETSRETMSPVVHMSYISAFFHNLAKAMDQADENDDLNMGVPELNNDSESSKHKKEDLPHFNPDM